MEVTILPGEKRDEKSRISQTMLSSFVTVFLLLSPPQKKSFFFNLEKICHFAQSVAFHHLTIVPVFFNCSFVFQKLATSVTRFAGNLAIWEKDQYPKPGRGV
jgi:hypothetical protein